MDIKHAVSPQTRRFGQTEWRASTCAIMRGASRLAIVALLCMGLLFAFAPQTYAASSITTHTSHASSIQQAFTQLHPSAAQRALVNCSGTNCNGANPYNSGCSSGAYIVPLRGDGGYTYYAQGNEGEVGDGYMNLMYSPTCGTNWSYVTNDYPQSDHIEAQIDNLSTDYYYWSGCYDCGTWASTMTYAPNSPAEADGWIVDPTYPNGLLIEPCLGQGSGNCWTNLPH